MQFDWDLVHRILGEFIGTAMLVFIGCMGSISGPIFPRDVLDSSLAWGLGIVCAVHCFSLMSSSHVNPVVTICALILGTIEVVMALIYIIVQFLGGFFGFLLVWLAQPRRTAVIADVETVLETAHNKLCCTIPDASVQVWQALLIEYFITSVLLFCVCGLLDPRSGQKFDSASLRLGFIVAGLCCIASPYTGASLNMARSLPPAVFNSQYKDFWIYIVGQLIASIVTPVLWRFVLSESREPMATEE